MLIRAFFLLALVFLFSCLVFSQQTGHPDFSGDWRFNLAQSKAPQGAAPDIFDLNVHTTLRVVQREPEFTASTIRPNDGAIITSSTYYTDGRESKTDDGKSVTKTKWDGAKLVTQIKPVTEAPPQAGTRNKNGTVNIGGGTVKREVRLEWELTANGQLILKTRITVRSDFELMGRRETKEDKTEIIKVYDRVLHSATRRLHH